MGTPEMDLLDRLPGHLRPAVHGFLDEACILAVTDVAGDIVFVNRAFCQISGYTAEQLLGRNHRILRSGRHPPEFYRELWSTVAGGRTWRGEICNRARDGHLYWVDTTISPLRSPAGPITHYLALRIDITARKRAEEQLREVLAREHEQKRAAALGRMADGMLHDLNNLLSGAITLAESMSGETSQDRDLMREVLRRMASLTRNLRDFSCGRPTARRRFALAPFLAEAVRLSLFSRVHRRELRVVTDLAALGDSAVDGNEGQLLEVCLNLLVNAAEALAARPDAEVRVSGSADAAAGKATIHFQDNGPGLPAETATRLFEPFSSTKGAGRGLGLSIARQLAEAHGGTLAATSSDRGTCFSLCLPLADARHTHAAVSACSGYILLSDDDPLIQSTLGDVLDRAGYRPVPVLHPDEILSAAERLKDGLAAAILDSEGGRLDHAVVGCLRELRPGLPIVLSSANLRTSGVHLTRHGVVYHLPKPFDPAALIEAIHLASAPGSGI